MASKLPSSQSEWLNLFSKIASLLHVPPARTSDLPDLDARTTPRLIDHTLLVPTATSTEISSLCTEAREYHFRTVCVRSSHVAQAKKELSGSDVGVASVIGFPSDNTAPSFTTEQKTTEAANAISDGATELDMVLNYEGLKEAAQSSDEQQPSNYTTIYEDIVAVRKAVAETVILKVILETSQLDDEDVARACVICSLAGADFVKTSTGFRGLGATAEVVRLMRTVCDVCQNEGLTKKRLQVKASGGVRSIADVRKMVSVGAERIGTSAGVVIMKGIGKGDQGAAKDITEITTVDY